MFYNDFMISFRKIRSFVAVFEEGSFTAAAQREGATQSGLSQQVRQLEDELKAVLLKRGARSVEPTPTGRRYYQDCIAILKRLDEANQRTSNSFAHDAELRVGLMPTFTRSVLAPTLLRFMEERPDAEIRITEAYSGVLTALVRKGELDFAVVPGFAGAVGLASSLFLRDREMLVSARGRTGLHGQPIRLSRAGPLKIVLPGQQNTRRGNIEAYCATNGVNIAGRLELDGMMGTLELVHNSDWVAILSSVIMAGDFGGKRFEIRPLAEPALDVDFVLIEPARFGMSPAARLFAEMLRAESERAITASL